MSRGAVVCTTKLTLSEAARACNVARTTIQRAVKTGRLSLDAEHRVDTADLLHVGYHPDAAVLHAASQQPAARQPTLASSSSCTGCGLLPPVRSPHATWCRSPRI